MAQASAYGYDYGFRSERPRRSRVGVLTFLQRRQCWSTAEKVRLVEQTMQPGSSVSLVARQTGISPNLLFRWKRRMIEGGHESVAADKNAVRASRVRSLSGARDLERLLGRKTMEVEALKEALDAARVKNQRCCCRPGALQWALPDEGRR